LRTDLDWSTVSLTDENAGYPICTFSYELVFSRMRTAYSNSTVDISPAVVVNVIDQLETIVDDSIQAQLPTYGFAPLPDAVLALSRNGVLAVSFS
jgi:hypothetical protein